jgi:fucose permease
MSNQQQARFKLPGRVFRALKPQLNGEQIRRFTACCLSLGMIGYHDGSGGPLLPYIQAHYHIQYNIVALLFVAYFVGAVSAIGANIWLIKRLGLGKVKRYLDL